MSEQQAEASERLAALSQRLAQERDLAFPRFTERLAAIEQELEALTNDIRAHNGERAIDENGTVPEPADAQRPETD